MYYEIKNKKNDSCIILLEKILHVSRNLNELKITYTNGVEIKFFIDVDDDWERARKEYTKICNLISDNQLIGSNDEIIKLRDYADALEDKLISITSDYNIEIDIEDLIYDLQVH